MSNKKARQESRRIAYSGNRKRSRHSPGEHKVKAHTRGGANVSAYSVKVSYDGRGGKRKEHTVKAHKRKSCSVKSYIRGYDATRTKPKSNTLG